MTKAELKYTGHVKWTPPAIYKSSCQVHNYTKNKLGKGVTQLTYKERQTNRSKNRPKICQQDKRLKGQKFGQPFSNLILSAEITCRPTWYLNNHKSDSYLILPVLDMSHFGT